jgi:hypothetical protein
MMESGQLGFKHRFALIPQALMVSGKAMIPVMVMMAGLSGFRAACYSFEHLKQEAVPVVITMMVGWLSGVVIGPLLLYWLPGERASFKGTMAGGVGLLVWPLAIGFLHLRPVDVGMALLLIPAMASFLMMRLAADGFFAPLTVEWREWRVALPVQGAMALVALVPWVMARLY